MRFRKNYKGLPGKPDIVFLKQNWLCFVMETSGTDIIGRYVDMGHLKKN